jgi:serine/threonine protein phosphatase PrpC
LALSDDHKPDRADEVKRIEAAGGFVSFRRVLGRLAVSRAFGDKEYKSGPHQLVLATPEIRVERLTSEDEFLLLACDGLFDVFTNQEACDYVRRELQAMNGNEQDPQTVVDKLVDDAIKERHSRDNVTAILLTFKRTL